LRDIMPRYEFACDDCEIFWEKFIMFSEFDEKVKKIKCPQCKRKKTIRQYLENKNIYGMVYQDPSTVQHQADRNTKNMGKYELESRLESDKIHQIKKQKEQYKPWYGRMSKEDKKKIENSGDAKKAIKKYIIDGET